MCTKLRLVLSTTILFLCFSGLAQNGYWRQETQAIGAVARTLQHLDKKDLKVYHLEEKALSRVLPSSKNDGRNIVYFPDAEGRLTPFSVSESPVFSPELSARYPAIRSYSGYSLADRQVHIRFSVSPKGLQSMMVSPGNKNATFIQKTATAGDTYVLYTRDQAMENDLDFICLTKSDILQAKAGTITRIVDDQTLRKYRIAISATGEYTQYHGGTVADALAAINATITRVNEVFERDLAVTLELVANDDQVIYTDPATDPYSGNLNTQVQNTLTTNIGEANYDVGHLFHKDSNGGNAGFIGSVCVNNQKGSAYSASTSPEGDIFDLDFVAHELGHQFGANHTWSFESEGTLVQVEPASGTTIMGYAGIVDGNNVASHGEDYFHYYSIFQIAQYLETTNCAQEMSLANTPPVINPTPDYIIPRGTPFVLEGSATDANAGDVLTYAWEEIDNGIVTTGSFGPDNPSGANFRSQKPSLSGDRYFPKLPEIVKGNITQVNPAINSAWETVSDIERDLNFALTVRDNAPGGGQVVSDLVKVHVLNNAGPFVVTSQATPATFQAGSNLIVRWDVANTDIQPVNAQRVDLLLSVDGGVTFPTVLAQDVLNDGEAEVQLPGMPTTGGRIMVKASDNIFLAVNAADFTIEQSSFLLNFPSLEFSVCQPDDLVIPATYETPGGFSEPVNFSASGLPAGLGIVFSPTSTSTDNTPVSITISNTSGAAAGSYPITIMADAVSESREFEIIVNIYNTIFTQVQLTSPANGTSEVSPTTTLDWEASFGNTLYDVQIALDAGFSTIIETTEVSTHSYLPQDIQPGTGYFWRVRPKNDCGEGTFGPAFNFTTITLDCKTSAAAGLPKTISATGTPTITSRISFSNDLKVSDINVILNLEHSFLSDLEVSLTSPLGTKIVLLSNSCGDLQDVDVVFDDEAGVFTCSGNPGLSGTMHPLGSLASFIGESTLGEWILEVHDNAPADGGVLNAFGLEVCVEGIFRPDDDGDGVFDDGDDLCPNTPQGTEVNTDGCPVYRFPSNNFSVAIGSESCAANNDGRIAITAAQSIDYMVVVTGPITRNEDFTETYSLEDLMAGKYTICITGSDGTNDFEAFCFDAVVLEPQPLGVSALVSGDGLTATLKLTGSDSYNIDLNGVVMRETGPEVILKLKEGPNLLKVTTDLPCQGNYEDVIFVSGKSLIYPNPFSGITHILLNRDIPGLQVIIHDATGKLVRNQNYRVNGADLMVDFGGLPDGMYFVTIDNKVTRETYKVIKR